MRINLNCSYDEKDEAKSLGARWDPGLKVWFIEDVADLKPYAKWLPIFGHKVRDAAKKKDHHAPKVTGTYQPICECETPPWEDCEHSEAYAQREMREMIGMDGFVF